MKKKFILILSLVALLSCIFVVSASADNGYAPQDIFLGNIGEFRGQDVTTYAIVSGYVDFNIDGNMYYEITAFNFNQTFYNDYVEGYNNIENIVTMFFAQNQNFSVNFYYYDNGNITENYFYSDTFIPYEEYWDKFVDTFRFSLHEQFGGWFERISSSSSTTVYSFSESLKDHMSAYKEACTSSGTAATYEGFNEYIEQNATSDFKANYNDNMKAFAQDMFSAGASSSTSSGGSSGGSSGSSGSGGSPNIPDDELGTFTGDFVGAGANGCTICGGGSDSLGCQHYQGGYVEGYDDALRSDTNKDNLQEAFDQGYYYANSEDFSTTIQNRIEESRDTHIEEYKKSTEFTEYLLSEEFTSSENHSKVIANYCNTQEFVDMLLENQSIGMNNFKASDEYAAILAAERLAGKDDGYQLGLEEGSISGYERGVDDGYAMFRGSDLFNQTLNQWYQNGYHDGVDDSTEDGPSIVGIVSVIIIVCGIFIGAFAISVKLRKRKK